MFNRRLRSGLVVIICIIAISLNLVERSSNLSLLALGNNKDEIIINVASNGYAVFEDVDAGTFVNDNAQSVWLTSPATLGLLSKSAFLNNVWTTTNYFLQNGFLFQPRTVPPIYSYGQVVYTSHNYGLWSQTYGIPYYSSRDYYFAITYTSNFWQLCAQDTTNSGTYTCIQDSSTQGNQMQGNINTAIFVEVIGTPTNWYLGYSTPFRFHSAKIYVNGSGQPWQQQHKHTAHHCGAIGTYPVDDAVKGTAITGGIGRFRLEGVPPRCP